MKYHPKSGLRYIMALRSQPPYRDAIALYSEIAQDNEWMEILPNQALEARMDEIAADERAFVMMWGVRCPIPPPDRKAMFVRVWSEAYDEVSSNLIGAHPGWIRILKSQLPTIDGLFAHTPWMSEVMARDSGRPSFVLPVGWSPSAMGSPNWEQEKEYRFTTWGKANAGKRVWLYPQMKAAMGDQHVQMNGVWGSRAIGILNQSSAFLYLSHSDVHSFSTFRTWQAVSSSAALIAEEGRDCWPMTDDMYVGIPTLTPENIKTVAARLLAMDDRDLLARARILHESLKHMTIDHVVERYLVPASMKIKETARA